MIPLLPDFAKVKEIGSGGYATIFRAIRRSDQRRVVIKSPHGGTSSEAILRERSIQREKKALRKFYHPNIVKFYHEITINGSKALELEFIDGKPADERILATVESKEDAILEILFQVVIALNEIHKNGVIHMDIKPQNILVTDDFVVKVIDFGIADLGTDEPFEQNACVSSGTRQYMAFELEDAGVFSTKSDVWSLGITLFHLATGNFPDLQSQLRLGSERLNRLCREMLVKNPENRISVAELLTELEGMIPSHSFEKVTVKVKRDGESEAQVLRLPESFTVGDLLDSLEPPDGNVRFASSNGLDLSPKCCLVTLAGQMIEIHKRSQPAKQQKQKVHYSMEGLPRIQGMITLPQSTTIGILLEMLARKGVDHANSIMIDGCQIPKSEEIEDHADSLFVISARPYVTGPPPQFDLVLVIDATWSMEAALLAARNYVYDFALWFRANRKLQLEIACVCYRDVVDCPDEVHQVHPFHPSLEKLREFLKTVEAKGGGDGPEDYVGAIEAIRNLNWRPTANHGIVWIADAPAHGERYCGWQNHQEEEPKLEPLVRALAQDHVKIQAFNVRGEATRTFIEMQKIYEAANPGLFFQVQDFHPGSGTIEIRAKTMATTISTTLGAVVHEFLGNTGKDEPQLRNSVREMTIKPIETNRVPHGHHPHRVTFTGI
jgi:serine/threonine protein kinase